MALQVQDYVSDPLNFVGKLRSRTGNELLKVSFPRMTASRNGVEHMTCVLRSCAWVDISRAVVTFLHYLVRDMQGFQALETRESELALPVLALHGTSDHTTSISAVKRLLKNCCSTDATFNEITGAVP